MSSHFHLCRLLCLSRVAPRERFARLSRVLRPTHGTPRGICLGSPTDNRHRSLVDFDMGRTRIDNVVFRRLWLPLPVARSSSPAGTGAVLGIDWTSRTLWFRQSSPSTSWPWRIAPLSRANALPICQANCCLSALERIQWWFSAVCRLSLDDDRP